MNLIFFDEVKNSPEYPHYHVGGICIDESNLDEIEEKVSLLSEEAFGTRVLGQNTEFHAAEIYHRKKHFKTWKDFDARINLIEKLIEILSLESIQLIDIKINCDFLSENQAPDEIAFMFFCERANALVRRNKSLGMLIGDRESDKVSERFSTSLSEYRATETDFAFGTKIENLVDSVHFTHSHLSRFLQLADIYVWLEQFLFRNKGSDNDRHKVIFDIMKKEEINLFPSKYKHWPKN